MASFRKHGKNWYYRFTDADGIKRETEGCTDRRATEELARAAETEAAKIKAGEDPKNFAHQQHATKPLADHLTAWNRDMVAKGKTAKHADQSLERVRRLVAVMFGAMPDDIDGKTMYRTQQEQARLAIARLVAKASAPSSLTFGVVTFRFRRTPVEMSL